MLTPERQKVIEDFVNQHGLCRVSDLCSITSTSESTIRRDLNQMAEKGLIKRVHGGAQSVKSFTHDVSQHIRFSMNHNDKKLIAQYAAANFVHQDDYIFIDAGTTTYEMVPFIADIPQVTVVTNGLETALCAISHGIETILLGGRIKENTHAVVGQAALKQLQGMNFSAGFVGTNGLDYHGNLTTPDTEEAAIKKIAIAQANQTYILADTSKIGECSFATFAQVKNVTVLTTALGAKEKELLPAKIKLKEIC